MPAAPSDSPTEAIVWTDEGPMLGASRVLATSLMSSDMLRQQLVHHVGESLARAIIAQAGKHGGFHDAHVLLQERSFGSLEAMVRAQYAQLAASGFGRFEIGELMFQHNPKEAYVRVRCYGSPEAESHRRLFGKALLPACWHLVGYSTGWTSAMTGLKLLTVESRCAARGDPHCEFETLLYQDFVGPEAAFWKSAFESTSTSLAQELEKKQGQLLGALEQVKQYAGALRSQTAATLIAQSASFEDAIPHVLASLCSEMGWDSSAFWLPDDKDQALRRTAEYPLVDPTAPDETTFACDVVFVGRVLRSRRAESSLDGAASRSDLATSCAFPVVVSENLTGVFEVRSKKPRPIDSEHLSTLEAFGARIGAVLAQKRAERASEIRYRLLFEQSPLPKMLYDASSLRILAVNHAATDAYGYPEEELLGLRLPDLEYAGADAPVPLDGKRDRPGLRRHRKKDGTSMTLEVTEHSFTVDGRSAVLSTNIDVSEKVRLEDQLRQAQKMEAVGQLAAGVAHEVNNPLTVILGFAEGVERRLANDAQAAWLRMPIASIVREAKRCRGLVQELLTFSRRSPQEARGNVDPNTVVRAAWRLLEIRAKVQGTRARLDLDLDVPTIRANAPKLEQLLVNLGNNALDALEQGGEIVLRTERSEQGMIMEVRDSGPGMPPEIRARIFEPFFTTKPVGKGTGLGLSLVHEITQQHGGTIEVISAPGEGSRFRVFLPKETV